MPDPDTPIDHLLDRLAHADLYHQVWRIADGFLNGETLGSAWIPPSPRTTDTPQQPNIGSPTSEPAPFSSYLIRRPRQWSLILHILRIPSRLSSGSFLAEAPSCG